MQISNFHNTPGKSTLLGSVPIHQAGHSENRVFTSLQLRETPLRYMIFILAVLIVGLIALRLIRGVIQNKRRKHSRRHRSGNRLPTLPAQLLITSSPKAPRRGRTGRAHAGQVLQTPPARQPWKGMRHDEQRVRRIRPRTGDHVPVESDGSAPGQSLREVKTPWGW